MTNKLKLRKRLRGTQSYYLEMNDGGQTVSIVGKDGYIKLDVWVNEDNEVCIRKDGEIIRYPNISDEKWKLKRIREHY